jgi:5'-nucleotidase
MRKKIFYTFFLLIFTAGIQAQRATVITVLNTNDTHSCIEPFNPNSTDKVMADKGGFLRRDAFVRSMRKTDKDLLLFDCGDFSQGSPYFNLFHGDVEIGLMSKMRYSAATIGNHEFDFGLDNMARIFRKANFPIVCANYGVKGTVLEGIVKPYVVLKRKGLRIGVFGLGKKMEGLVQAKNCVGVTYEDPVTAAQRVTNILRDSLHCDLVICLSHLGWNIGEDDDNRLIPNTYGIDLVLGGHSHTLFDAPRYLKNSQGKSIPDYQLGKNAAYVGCTKLTFVPAKKK